MSHGARVYITRRTSRRAWVKCHNDAAHFIVEQKNPGQVAWSRTTYGFVISAMLTYKKWGAPIQQLPTIQQVIQCGC